MNVIEIKVFKYERALGGSFIKTPKSLAMKKATINPDNSRTGDNYCLHYALAEHFLHQDNNRNVKDPQRLSVIRPYLGRVNLKDIPMPTPIDLHIFDKIER